jgi:prepilin-type N-terminal cleavage/methylation domain-containing protein
MKRCNATFLSGFTLIELMVVIALIGILSLFGFEVFFNARKEARDTIRVSDMEQLKLGITLYNEAHGEYPDYTSGASIGTGGSIDTELKPFLPTLRGDPLDGESGYVYTYYSNVSCSSPGEVIVLAETMENAENANFASVCTSPSGGIGTNSSYVVIVKK